MNEPKDNYRTAAFQTFKREFSYLSRLHWFYTYGARFVCTKAQSETSIITSRKSIGTVLPADNFDPRKLGIYPSQYVNEEDDAAEHLRLILLVKGCASAEAFLHKSVAYWAASQGHVGVKPNKLNKIGEALIRPATVSNIHSIAVYIKDLMGIDLSKQMEHLLQAYRIRCVAAHTGGIVEPGDIKNLGFIKDITPGSRLHLTWGLFVTYLGAIHSVCDRVEMAVPSIKRRSVEIRWLIQDIIDSQKAPNARATREMLFQAYGNIQAPSISKIATEFKIPKETNK